MPVCIFFCHSECILAIAICARFHIETLELFTVGNMMMADSSAVYAAVVCTNRTPIQGVQQNDEMYGNIIMLHEQNGKH